MIHLWNFRGHIYYVFVYKNIKQYYMVRKHQVINQSGGRRGKLKKGYRYSGKRTKTGLPIIVKGGKTLPDDVSVCHNTTAYIKSDNSIVDIIKMLIHFSVQDIEKLKTLIL